MGLFGPPAASIFVDPMGSSPLAIMLTAWLCCAEILLIREKETVVGYLASTCEDTRISYAISSQGRIFPIQQQI